MYTADAAVRGLRGVPNEIAVLGASNYLNETLRPGTGGSHARTHHFTVDRSPAVAGRGKITEERARSVCTSTAQASATLQDAFHQAATLSEMTAPVHIRDLKDVAQRTTDEMVERETEVLRYRVYSVEVVVDNPTEPVRNRVYDLSYFTTDCTMSVFERSQENSGLQQGAFARRHHAMHPDGTRPYVPSDLTIGTVVRVYSREFVIIDADARTREVLSSKYGVFLAPGLPEPPVAVSSTSVLGHTPKSNTVCFDMGKEEDVERGFFKKAGDTRRQFLERGAAVLKFECEWREPGASFSDRRKLALQYYLADDTMEILDRTSAYSSGGLFNKVLQRQRLPRMPIESGKEGFLALEAEGATPLMKLPPAEAVVAISDAIRAGYEYNEGTSLRAKFTSPITGRPLFTPPTSSGSYGKGPLSLRGIPVLSSRASTPAFVTAADVVCGGIISVYGRPLLVRTCDPFAVAYMMHNFGVDVRETFVYDHDVSTALGRVVPLLPFVGALAMGSEEETRMNATKLIPTFRSERDFDRFYQLGGKALKFEAVLDPESADPEDVRRRFVISFYLEDNTMSVGELTGNTLGHGPSVVRYLNRGRYRNVNACVDVDATAALGIKEPITAMPTSVMAAYDRVYGASRDKMGYTESSGAQGYSGGIFGKAERVGAGATGVESAADLGIRNAALHAMPPLPRFFAVEDFSEGARVQFAHSPTTVFILQRADRFTLQFLQAQASSECKDPKDVYVPENSVPVPTLPLESVKLEDDSGVGSEVQEACLTIAKILAGVLESAKAGVRQADKAHRGIAPAKLVKTVLASYGVQPPACGPDTVDIVLETYTVGAPLPSYTASSAAYGGGHGYGPAGGSPAPKPAMTARPFTAPASAKSRLTTPTITGSMDDPLKGPFLRDYAASEYSGVAMVDYNRLFEGIKNATQKQLALQPRIDKLLSQLRTAVLSSRSHLRRVFRDLDSRGIGAVSLSEFRHLLGRHNLDVGISDAQLRALMSRFQPATAAAVATLGEEAIDWRGFVEALLERKTMSNEEVDTFTNFVRGLRDGAEDGVGTSRAVPQMAPRANAVAAWTHESADPTQYLRAMGSQGPSRGGVAAPLPPSSSRPSTAPSAPSARSSVAFTEEGGSRLSTPGTSVRGAGTGVTDARRSAPIGGSPIPVLPVPSTVSGGGRNVSFKAAHNADVPSLPHNPVKYASASALSGSAYKGPVVDVIAALAEREEGQSFLASLQQAFSRRRFDLYRALNLYDTSQKRVLDLPSFTSALASAGLKWDRRQMEQFKRLLTTAAAAAGSGSTAEQDLSVDYNRFFDQVFENVQVAV